eukprot:scaffold144953_cov30-Tisochrysis_lutea.AAC.1
MAHGSWGAKNTHPGRPRKHANRAGRALKPRRNQPSASAEPIACVALHALALLLLLRRRYSLQLRRPPCPLLMRGHFAPCACFFCVRPSVNRALHVLGQAAERPPPDTKVNNRHDGDTPSQESGDTRNKKKKEISGLRADKRYISKFNNQRQAGGH